MYAITGITGQVGGAVARNLLSAKCPVRAVLRDVGKAAPWAARGCDIALAAIDDAAALTAAFQGAEGILPPVAIELRPGAGLSRGAADRNRGPVRPRGGASGQARLPLDNRRPGRPAEPAQPAWHHGNTLENPAHAGRLPAAGMVYGERGLGRVAAARPASSRASCNRSISRSRWSRPRISAGWRRRCFRRRWRVTGSSNWKGHAG